jgi:hypothetical protein
MSRESEFDIKLFVLHFDSLFEINMASGLVREIDGKLLNSSYPCCIHLFLPRYADFYLIEYTNFVHLFCPS